MSSGRGNVPAAPFPAATPADTPFLATNVGLNAAAIAAVPMAELAIDDIPLDARALTTIGVARSESARIKLNEITVRKLMSVLFMSLRALLQSRAASVASPEGATLSLKVEPNGDRVSILVRDEGSGIPEKLHGKIFEPNFTTKGNKGTGLGLFVVKQICEQYGGRIAVSSGKGGTSFTLDFPRVEVSP